MLAIDNYSRSVNDYPKCPLCDCVNTYEMGYSSGYARLASTLTQAGNITPNCNALCIRVQTQDKHGICHHLANEDRFVWVKKNG